MQRLGENFDVLTQGLVTGFSGLMMNGNLGGGNASPFGPGGSKANELVFATFNQDTTSLAVGTSSGYKLYTLNSTDTLEPIYENPAEDVYIVERLFSSSLVAVVSQSAPRKLKVCHFKRGTEICNYSYTSKILAVRMNRARLVVCLEESLFIHNIRDMKVLHTIRETPPNKNGMCALSTDSDHCYLAYPGHSTVGELQIFDALNLAATSMIPAHTGQLAAIQFSPSGTRIATASDKGTVIRVFSVADGTRLYELRRGLKRTADIYSLSFSPCGHFLACSSNTETVHVFRLEDKPKDSDIVSQSPPAPSNDSWMGYLSNVVSASANYLPSQVTDTLMQGRAFATVHHNNYGRKNICALSLIKKSLRVLLASEDGFLYMYSLDVTEGGDCQLIRQFRLTDMSPDPTRQEQQALEKDSSSPQQQHLRHSESPVDIPDGKRDSRPEDSEKFHEMTAATETPPKPCFLLSDDDEFPPMIATNSPS